MEISDYTTELNLRSTMYKTLGYIREHGHWHKYRASHKPFVSGMVKCRICKEWDQVDIMIKRGKGWVCIECEKKPE